MSKKKIIEKLEKELAISKEASERCNNNMNKYGGTEHDHYVAGANRGIFLGFEKAIEIVKEEQIED